MSANKNAAPEANRAALDTAFSDRNSTVTDPLKGWFDLAKPSRDRKPKSAWKRGKQRGDAMALFHALTAFLSFILLALAWWHL
jgi:hypothetical protein